MRGSLRGRLRACQFIANRGPGSSWNQLKLRWGRQRHRSSHHNLSVFETVNGRPDLINPAYFNGPGQRIFVYASLFKLGPVVSQPVHNAIRILLYLCFATIRHNGLLTLDVGVWAQA